MAKVVELTVPAEQFALAEVFNSVPDAEFEAVPVVAHSPGGAMTVLSATSSLPERMMDALEADGTTADVVALSRRNGRQLYRISWQARVRTVLDTLLRSTGSLMGARGTADRWELRFLFPEDESASVIYENWRSHGINPSVKRVMDLAGEFGLAGMDLSACQHDTLLRAYEMDYYEVPRGATLECVASDLQVSHQALSERLRRGHCNLIRTTLSESNAPLSTGP